MKILLKSVPEKEKVIEGQ